MFDKPFHSASAAALSLLCTNSSLQCHQAHMCCPCFARASSRKRLEANGAQRQESEILEIAIKPGWKAGTKITFQEKGAPRPPLLGKAAAVPVQWSSC
jgi:hypothetical protein